MEIQNEKQNYDFICELVYLLYSFFLQIELQLDENF